MPGSPYSKHIAILGGIQRRAQQSGNAGNQERAGRELAAALKREDGWRAWQASRSR